MWEQHLGLNFSIRTRCPPVLVTLHPREQPFPSPVRHRGLDIHKIKPVKFGGSPTNVNNKLFLDSRFHETQVNPFWDKLKKGIQ
jgi:hypothetical protein